LQPRFRHQQEVRSNYQSTGAVPSSTQAINEEIEQLLASGGSLPEFQEAFAMYREGIIPSMSGAAVG